MLKNLFPVMTVAVFTFLFALNADEKKETPPLPVNPGRETAAGTETAGSKTAAAGESASNAFPLDGFDASLRKFPDGSYRSRTFLKYAEAESRTDVVFWNIFKGESFPFAERIKLFPRETLLLSYGRFDLALAEKFFLGQCAAFDLPALARTYTLAKRVLFKTGISKKDILDSYAGEFGYALTSAPDRKKSLFPFHFISLVKFKNDVFFKKLISLLPSFITSTSGVNKENFAIVLPIPWTHISLTFARCKDYLLFATSVDGMRSVMASVSGGASLASDKDAVKLLGKLNPEGTSFSYVGRGFLQTLEGTERFSPIFTNGVLFALGLAPGRSVMTNLTVSDDGLLAESASFTEAPVPPPHLSGK